MDRFSFYPARVLRSSLQGEGQQTTEHYCQTVLNIGNLRASCGKVQRCKVQRTAYSVQSEMVGAQVRSSEDVHSQVLLSTRVDNVLACRMLAVGAERVGRL